MVEVIVLLMFYTHPTPHIQEGVASFYTVASSSTITASGERMKDDALTCAMLTGELGSYYLVESDAGRAVIVRLNDRGPYIPGRIIDLSRAAMQRLGGTHDGLVNVRVVPLDLRWLTWRF